MRRVETDLPGVAIIETDVHHDSRGFFSETFHQQKFAQLGLEATFVQDNYSYSVGAVIRGLHYQEPFAQGKLVSVLQGAIFDVAVDIRPNSPNYKKWVGVELRPELGRMFWIPAGFAHGFATLTETAGITYKVTGYWNPATERLVNWKDPELAIEWPIDNPVISEKDAAAPMLRDASILPEYIDS